MDQGWHHQGFRDQKGGRCSRVLESAEALESTRGVKVGEIVIATNQLPIDENLGERGHGAAGLPALEIIISIDGVDPVLYTERSQET